MNNPQERPVGSAPSERLLTFEQLSDKVGMKRTAIYAAINAGSFPVPVKIGKLSRWVEGKSTPGSKP